MAHKEWEGTAHSGRSLHPYLRTNLNCGLTSLSVKPPENSGSRYGSPGREPLVLGNRTASKGAHVKWLPSPEEEVPRPAMSQRRSGAVSRLDTVYASPAVLRQLHRLVRKTSQTRSPRTHDLLRDTVRELRSAMNGDGDGDGDGEGDSTAGTPQQLARQRTRQAQAETAPQGALVYDNDSLRPRRRATARGKSPLRPRQASFEAGLQATPSRGEEEAETEGEGEATEGTRHACSAAPAQAAAARSAAEEEEEEEQQQQQEEQQQEQQQQQQQQQEQVGQQVE